MRPTPPHFSPTILERIYPCCCAFDRKKPIFLPPRYLLYYGHNDQQLRHRLANLHLLKARRREERKAWRIVRKRDKSGYIWALCCRIGTVGQIFNGFPNSTLHIHKLHTHTLRCSVIQALQLFLRISIERIWQMFFLLNVHVRDKNSGGLIPCLYHNPVLSLTH